MSLRILFISDNNLTHPILQAQGIPQILQNASEKVQFSLMTFERGRPGDPVYTSLRDDLRRRRIAHVPVHLPKNLFPSGRFWVWCLGISKGVWTCVRFRPRIIHVRSYPPMFIALILKGLFGPSVIFDMRGIFVDETVEAGIIAPGSLLYRIERTLEYIYIRGADFTVSVSQAHHDYMMNLLKYPKFAEKNFVIPNCADVLKFEKVRPLKGTKKVRLLYLGQNIVKYDMDAVFEFFLTLNKHCAESYLRIVTYGPTKVLALKLLSLPERVRRRIEVLSANSAEIPKKMNGSSAGLAFLYPLPGNRVSAPIKLMEYLAAGIPIVVSENVGDAEPIIRKYNVGVVLRNSEYDAAVRDLLHILESKDLEERCRSVVAREFNLTQCAEKYLALYKLLQNDTRRGSVLK